MKILSKAGMFLALTGIIVFASFVFTSFKPEQKVKIGFLVHDLVSERWQTDMKNFANKVEELGGVAITKNAFGDANTQVAQGKSLIDDGVKVIAVVAQDGLVLGELVDYADKAGAKIIAYDRMILNSNLHYYISFNSIMVGELMAEYALRLKPNGNYVIINGPSTDHNALLVRQGIANKLKKHIESGNVKVLFEKECGSWYALSSLMIMDEFLPYNKEPIDVIIAGSDDLASGAIDAIKSSRKDIPLVTGQDATLDACKNILLGYQSMTIYKPIKKLSNEAAILAMKIASNEKVDFTTTLNNGKTDVPSILFDPIVIHKNNLQETLLADGHIKESDLK